MKSNTSKQYAIKVIDKRAVKGKEPFLANEIFVLKQLDHPNIIKFHEVYQSELYFYICMDYCQGGELVERLAKQQQILTEGQVQSIIFKVRKLITRYALPLGTFMTRALCTATSSRKTSCSLTATPFLSPNSLTLVWPINSTKST